MRTTEAGQPYAGFSIDSGVGPPLGVTAILRGPVLQFVAHDLLGGASAAPPNLGRCNRAWGLGRVYTAADGRTVDASVGLLAGDEPGPEDVRATLGLLVTAAEPLRALLPAPGPEALEDFAEWVSLQVFDLPPVDPAVARARLIAAAEATGYRTDPRPDGVAFLLRDERDRVRIEAAVDSRILTVEASPADGGQNVTHEIDAIADVLNAGLPLGAVLAEGSRPRFRAVLSLATCVVDDDDLTWLIDVAMTIVREMQEMIRGKHKPV